MFVSAPYANLANVLIIHCRIVAEVVGGLILLIVVVMSYIDACLFMLYFFSVSDLYFLF